MATKFNYDVFLSHSIEDKMRAHELANYLNAKGLTVCFEEWVIRAHDNILTEIEDGLQNSRMLLVCVSTSMLPSDWAQLESDAYPFTLNRERRLIPLRLDYTEVKGPLESFSYINLQEDLDSGSLADNYDYLLEACRPPKEEATTTFSEKPESLIYEVMLQWHIEPVSEVVFNANGSQVLTASEDTTLRLWDTETGNHLQVFQGHQGGVKCGAISSDGSRILSGSEDGTVLLWDAASGRCLQKLAWHSEKIWSVAFSPNGTQILFGTEDGAMYLCNLNNDDNPIVMREHRNDVRDLAFSAEGDLALSASMDSTVCLWDLASGVCLRVMEGHKSWVQNVEFSPDGLLALSACDEGTIRLWELASGNCLRVLEGHTDWIMSVVFSHDGRLILSGSADQTLRLWDAASGFCLHVIEGHSDLIFGINFSPDGQRVQSLDASGTLRVWDLTDVQSGLSFHHGSTSDASPVSEQTQYTNAKVLLVGNSAAGKTGLSNRLAHDTYTETDSTVGAWATQWHFPSEQTEGIEREIWLWDFGGQADQRLIHQLYMEQTQVAALVFDPQKDDLLTGLQSWDRDLTRAATGDFQKILVAGRIDAGGLRSVSRHQLEEFAREHGFARYIETSAKEKTGCEELKKAIKELIDWDKIAKRTTPVLFKRLKEAIIALKDEGRILLRFNELRDALLLRMGTDHFTDSELKTVVSLLTGPGVVWELGFGSWILLAPELINAYAQTVIRTLGENERQMGWITEETVLAGKLSFAQGFQRLAEEDERILLLGMHKLLVENNLCLSEKTDSGTLLIFPSYARRERPEQINHPSVLVSYSFDGFLDDIYATLVVRLHRTTHFELQNLWRDAADFESDNKQKLGIKLLRKSVGKAELLLYFDPAIPLNERMIFSKYVQEHLFRKVAEREQVKRLRHWFCEHCAEPVANRERAMQRLHDNGKDAKIICVNCEKYVQLWDEMEDRFADPDIRRRVRQLEAASQQNRDNESKERELVGNVISTVAIAGQISREISVSDHGLDMEIEFKNDKNEATGQRLYLQLKSGDSHLKKRKRDGALIFKISKARHVRYWMDQPCPVMLVIQNSDGEIHWMEIGEYLKESTNDGAKIVRQIEFVGERFDESSVHRWRKQILGHD